MEDFISTNVNEEQSFLSRQNNMEERIWIDSNTSKIDDLLRINYDKSLEEFSDIVLTAVADLMEAIRGAFYIVLHEEKLISAIAGYACELDSMIKREFRIGDDLVGFAVKSKKLRYIDHLPVANVVINSGLAHISSTCVVITPLIFNDLVYGVIELNFLAGLPPKYLELLQRLSRNIASTLQSIENNVKTKRLLEELQYRNESMAAQEEELRQNLEEMHTLQDAMQKKQEEMEMLKIRLEKNESVLKKAILQNRENEKALKEELRTLKEELAKYQTLE